MICWWVWLSRFFWGIWSQKPVAVAAPAKFHQGERRETRSLEQAHFTFALEAPA